MTITQEELKKLLHYEPETGVFTRLTAASSRIKIGDAAGSITNKNNGNRKSYIEIMIDGRRSYAHRLAWLYMTGSLPILEIDHINGNGCDNRWINLRSVDRLENGKNLRISKRNTSGISGVGWFKRVSKWRARITVKDKEISLGYFDNISDAICARKNAEIRYCFHENHGSDRPL